MILYDTKFNKDLHLELVDGTDIIKTYRSRFWVRSCLSTSSRTRFFLDVPGCKVLRLIKSNLFSSIVHARALVWIAKTEGGKQVTLLDKIYSSGFYETDPYSLTNTFKEYFDYSIPFHKHRMPYVTVDLPEKYVIQDKPQYGKMPWLDNFTHLIKTKEGYKLALCGPDWDYRIKYVRGKYGRWHGEVYYPIEKAATRVNQTITHWTTTSGAYYSYSHYSFGLSNTGN